MQIAAETDNTLNVVHVLAATAAGGLTQSLLGGQTLLIVGVAEPIVLVYKYMYDFSSDKEGLGPDMFLAWAAWASWWAGCQKRYLVLEKTHAPYVEIVKFRKIVMFTLIQATAVGVVYGITWAGVAGVLFPLPIMALVPFRQYVLPRFFSPTELDALDKLEEEQVESLEHDKAIVVAASAGLGVVGGGKRGSVELTEQQVQVQGKEGEEMLGSDILISPRYRVVHHVSSQELEHRIRFSSDGDGGNTGDEML